MMTRSITVALSAALLCTGAMQATAASSHPASRHATDVASRPTAALQVARGGADNTAADKGEARGKGADGARHGRTQEATPSVEARGGADDGPNHEAGEHAGGDDHGGNRGGRG